MSETSLITDKLKKLLNVEFGPYVYEVEKGMVKKFVEAIDDPNPIWQNLAPPTFLAAPAIYIVSEIITKLEEAECPPSGFNGGTEFEYYSPIKVGDVIYITGRIVDFQERQGKSGKMLFIILDITSSKENGQVLGIMRNTIIRL